MSLILDEQFLSGFVPSRNWTRTPDGLRQRGSACTPRTDSPKGWRTLPCDTGEELLSAVETAAGQSGKRRTSCW